MIDFERHFKRLQDTLGVKNALGKNCVDVIDEGLWWNVMYELNQASIEAADELQGETGRPYPKDSGGRSSCENCRGVKNNDRRVV